MKTRPYVVHALSPLHAGTGQSAGVIDLPIARMKATGIPFVPGSSIKGVLRDATRPERAHSPLVKAKDSDEHHAMFGPARQPPGPAGDRTPADRPEDRPDDRPAGKSAGKAAGKAAGKPDDKAAGKAAGGNVEPGIEHAGAVMVADARLMALPVRSFCGTFAMVTSPLLLDLVRRDLDQAGESKLPTVPRVARDQAYVATNCVCVPDREKHIYLEDLDLSVTHKDEAIESWRQVITGALPASDQALMSHRLVIVDDETMTFLWETATQVDARISIDHDTQVVKKGGLWTEESLPPETLLLGLMCATRSMRKGTELDPATMLDRVLPESGAVLQFGGKATIGKGRCRMSRWQRGAASKEGKR